MRSLSISILDGELVGGEHPGDLIAVDLLWKVGFNWPTLWAPRVSLSGVTRLKLSLSSPTPTVHSWTDRLSGNPLTLPSRVLPQLFPRFWDVYHIGMAPSSELLERHAQPVPSFLPRPYRVYEAPSYLTLKVRERAARHSNSS